MKDDVALGDIGERALISQVLAPRYGAANDHFGDDCARVLEVEELLGPVVASTDPCPIPVASLLGFDDFYYWGWLLGVINLSDIAAAGAVPRSFLASYELPRSMLLKQFLRILDGLDECCAKSGAAVVGGNLKEAKEVALSGTAIGTCLGQPLSRKGAKVGDVVLVLGDLGLFWAGYLSVTRGLESLRRYRNRLLRNVLTPQPKVAVGSALARASLVTAVMDNSDGLFPSLNGLCHASRVGVRLNFSAVGFSEEVLAVAAELDVDPVRLALGWGDWQLVATAAAGSVHMIEDACSLLGVPVHHVGEVIDEEGVHLVHEGHSGRLLTLDSERFAADSWFTAGLEAYVSRLLGASLIE
ncbi:thiamine-phosphate kinase [Asanoa sp. WMMD1127]|uniref:thiamine-phosphate kinase n=1 Tax=Asanoa sp. WMMD1127 TaxID=3016107 RepID=UPI00241687F6|nr:thiamine-phosphate kinase [Asanoa sp. WMMD1127]MDG4821910.1 thiamine-phosphate kinase [Asanoa sp. WMMD1127]